MDPKPPLPPFTHETAVQKVRMAEDAWNTRDPDKCVMVYSEDTRWRNRNEFPVGRDEVHALSDRKFHWPIGRRPDDHPSLSDLDL